ncbi:MAG: zinc ABC transporter substrate-binding protein [Oscillospiraceae bacterium]|nr:zinc ABC transporter substrate-binding protein [Oscillospiraceae bacterium]
MKQLQSFILICVLCLSLTACGDVPEQADDGKLTIVTTIFPEYDWLRNLTAGSENVEVQLLIDKGVDLHSYQPSVKDIVKISTCDVFIYTGGASDVWVEDALETAMNEDMLVIDLMELLEQHRELCTEEHDHEHDYEEHDHEEHDHEHTADEHIWLSLVNAGILCRELTEQLQVLDSENAELYASNYTAYAAEIEALDERYHETVKNAAHHNIVFGDRFPFAYLAEDYDLHCHAAYEGCSAETEVSFQTFAELAAELDELNLDYVVIIDDSDHRIADTVIASSADKSRTICTMQSMQAVSARQIRDGATYLGIMEENLSVLQQVLN